MERLAFGPVLRSEVALCGRLAIVIVSYIDLYLNSLTHKPVKYKNSNDWIANCLLNSI